MQQREGDGQSTSLTRLTSSRRQISSSPPTPGNSLSVGLSSLQPPLAGSIQGGVASLHSPFLFPRRRLALAGPTGSSLGPPALALAPSALGLPHGLQFKSMFPPHSSLPLSPCPVTPVMKEKQKQVSCSHLPVNHHLIAHAGTLPSLPKLQRNETRGSTPRIHQRQSSWGWGVAQW